MCRSLPCSAPAFVWIEFVRVASWTDAGV
jgi:hypothetical protein